jgi:hypothetical protein
VPTSGVERVIRRGRSGPASPVSHKPFHTMSEPEGGDSRRGAIAGLIIAVVLLALGIWLAHDLTAASKMQDCLMSGRTNCNVIQPAQ